MSTFAIKVVGIIYIVAFLLAAIGMICSLYLLVARLLDGAPYSARLILAPGAGGFLLLVIAQVLLALFASKETMR